MNALTARLNSWVFIVVHFGWFPFTLLITLRSTIVDILLWRTYSFDIFTYQSLFIFLGLSHTCTRIRCKKNEWLFIMFAWLAALSENATDFKTTIKVLFIWRSIRYGMCLWHTQYTESLCKYKHSMPKSKVTQMSLRNALHVVQDEMKVNECNLVFLEPSLCLHRLC